MTKPPETKERFVELRASGMTLTKVAQELDIAYNTAVNWEKEFKEIIDAAKAIRLEELLEQYRINKEKRIELLSERLLALHEELSKRNFSGITTVTLYDLMIKCSKALASETIEFGPVKKEDIETRKPQEIH